MMICTLSVGDKSRSIGFGGAAASWDFWGCGSQRGGTGEGEGGKVRGDITFPSLAANVNPGGGGGGTGR